MKPFDLKAAQAGEPIVRYYSPEWDSFPVLFVGVTKSGLIAVEPPEGTAVYRYPASELRMAPKKLKLYIEIAFHNGVIHNSWATQKTIEQRQNTPEWQYRYATIEVDAP